MGQLVSSYMERQNERSLVPFDAYVNYRKYGPQAVPLPDTARDDRSAIYVMANVSADEFAATRRDYGEPSCVQVVESLCRERGTRTCLAYRHLIDIERHTVTDAAGRSKTMETYVYDPTRRTMSYVAFWQNIVDIGVGLRRLGLRRGDRVTIYAETRWEWLVTMYGCWSQGLVVVTVYANLGEAALLAALREAECQAMVCAAGDVTRMCGFMRGGQLHTMPLVYFAEFGHEVKETTTTAAATAAANGNGNGVAAPPRVLSWESVLRDGHAHGSTDEHDDKKDTSKHNNNKSSDAADADDDDDVAYKLPGRAERDEVALIMYTSGTTGSPKGVMHTHGSLAAGVAALSQRVDDLIGKIIKGGCYCSYLPLAHIMEFGLTSVFMILGVVIGYGTPRTLTDQFAKPHGDLREYGPVLLGSVPRVYETMRRAVEAKLPKPGTLKRRIFDNAYAARLRALKAGKDTPYYNEKVFKAPRTVIGGKLYGMLSGGGPLSRATQEFINVVFGVVVQGYGLTETVCVGAIQRTGNLDYHDVGQILKGVELQLCDIDDYKHTDTPEPRGEICLRGPFLFKGYYKQPELTREALDDDGWFHTGDVGSIASDGRLRVIGRVKALAKNALGEYIALEYLESLYGTNEVLTPNGVCVLVHPDKPYITLLGTTNRELVEAFVRKNKLSIGNGNGGASSSSSNDGKGNNSSSTAKSSNGNGSSSAGSSSSTASSPLSKGATVAYPQVLQNDEFNAKVLQSMQATARALKRPSFEIVKKVRLLDEEWTPSNGLLTAAMKLKRSAVEEKYKDIIAELFAED